MRSPGVCVVTAARDRRSGAVCVNHVPRQRDGGDRKHARAEGCSPSSEQHARDVAFLASRDQVGDWMASRCRASHQTGGQGCDLCLIAAGMMIPAALAAARVLEDNGVTVTVLNVPVIKPLDGATIIAAARNSRMVITAENHTIMGGLGSAVAEALTEAGVGVPLRRIGIADVFAESGSREFLFQRYGLGTQNILDVAWRGLRLSAPVPVAPVLESSPGAYAPV